VATTVAPATPAGAPAVHNGYVVRAGDTLSGIAASAGVPVSQLAAMNGLAADAYVITGTVMRMPNGAATPANASAPLPATRVVPQANPLPTPGRLDGARVAAIAAEHGVPGALAAAIGWQESGFNNAMVSSANARGIMQVMPGTWNWIQDNLADRSLDPGSAEDNVRAGALYLRQLLRATGGDEAAAAAGYYQGLRSVQERGMYDDTRQYVNNVLALKSRFGG
jgi:soluble lytic murein transglycosylase-like protein